jgi:hypothetical protein
VAGIPRATITTAGEAAARRVCKSVRCVSAYVRESEWIVGRRRPEAKLRNA